MKRPVIYIISGLLSCLSISACTMGDKGSEKVPDSVRIDTLQKATTERRQTDTGGYIIDSLQTDTGQFSGPQKK